MNQKARSCLHLLREIAELCEHASLTGSYAGGEGRVARRYNSIVEHLEDEDALPHDLFEKLSEDAGFSEVGIEARMLCRFLDGEEKEAKGKKKKTKGDPDILIRLAPFVRRGDLAKMVRDQMRHGARFPGELLTQLAPFLDREALGEMVREQMSHGVSIDLETLTRLAPFMDGDFLSELVSQSLQQEDHDEEEAEEPEEPEESSISFDFGGFAAPAPPTAPAPPQPSVRVNDESRGTVLAVKEEAPLVSVSEGNVTLDDLLDALRNPHLVPEERNRLLEQVRELI
ncbi:hypothetical protein BH11ARM2_BH11ARM2_07240 [soil metagenome]